MVEATPGSGKAIAPKAAVLNKGARAFWRSDWAQLLKAGALLRHKGSVINPQADSSLSPYKTPSTHPTTVQGIRKLPFFKSQA